MKKNHMSPEEMRNLLIFFVFAVGIYLVYDAYFLRPQAEAMRRYQAAQTVTTSQAGVPSSVDHKGPEKYVARDLALSNASPARVTLENGVLKATVALKGARFDDASLRTYFKELDKKETITLLTPRGAQYSRTVEYGWISEDSAVSLPDSETLWQIDTEKTKEGAPVLFWENGQGLRFERRMTLDDQYMVTVTDSVVNHSQKPVTLHPYGLISQKGVPEHYSSVWVSYEGPIGYIGEELFQHEYSTLRQEKTKSVSADRGWIGITEKYWQAALIPPQGEQIKYGYGFSGADQKDKDNKGIYQTDYMGSAREIPAGGQTEVISHLFVGAKHVFALEQYEDTLSVPHFDLSVDFGWFWFLTKPFFFALHYLGEWTGNMGIAIILLTLLIRGSTFPLTSISHHSAAKMRKVAPQIAELRKQYADDKGKLQQGLVKLYESEGVNPMAGCFPVLIQIPVFFALYKMFFVTIELRHAPFFGWIKDLTAPDPTNLFNLFGLLPWSVPLLHAVGVWSCLFMIVMILQTKLNPPPQDPVQKDMMRFMPFIITYVMSGLASGIVIYYVFSGMINFLQQIIIMRRLGVPIHLFGQAQETPETALAEAAGEVSPLEIVEAEVEQVLFAETAGGDTATGGGGDDASTP